MKKRLVLAMSLTTGEVLQNELCADAGSPEILDTIMKHELEMENGPIVSRGYYVNGPESREHAYTRFADYIHVLYAIGTLV